MDNDDDPVLSEDDPLPSSAPRLRQVSRRPSPPEDAVAKILAVLTKDMPQLTSFQEAIARLFAETKGRQQARYVAAYAAGFLYLECSKRFGERQAKRIFAGLGKPRSKLLRQQTRKTVLRWLYQQYVAPLDLDLQRAAKDLVEDAPDIWGDDKDAIERIRAHFREFRAASGKKGTPGRPRTKR
jgi:hypothetical protein